MKLSEAILLGIGAVRNDPAVWLSALNDCHGCAIGTALWAAGQTDNGWVYHGIKDCYKIWPWTKTVLDGSLTIAEIISSRHCRNESRESIAQWVAELEKIYDPDTASMPEVSTNITTVAVEAPQSV